MPSLESNERFEAGKIYKLRFISGPDNKRIDFTLDNKEIHFEIWDAGEGKGKFKILDDNEEVVAKSSEEAPSMQEAFMQLKQKASELGIVPEIPGSSKWIKKPQGKSGGGVEVRA